MIESAEGVDIVERTRQALGPVGAFLMWPLDRPPSVDTQRRASRRLEDVGFGAAWVNEGVGGKDALVQLALLLSCTERMIFGTGIANIWARPAQTAHAAASLLAQAFPGRLVLGQGVGFSGQAKSVGQELTSPARTMRSYLEQMTAPTPLPALNAPYPRIVAANGPKMLEVARDMADGAVPSGQPPEFTKHARQTIGPHKLLVVLTETPLGHPVEEVVADVRGHRTAGADHVVVLLPKGTDFHLSIDYLEQLGTRIDELATLPYAT